MMAMVAMGRWLAGVVCGVAALSLLAAAAARQPDNEDDLQARLQRESNPVKKAKLGMRLGRVKLQKAIAAYDDGKIEQGAESLKEYEQVMNDSWQTLQRSGRQATRQPQGFKELDIALREDSRLLVDLAHRTSYFDRAAIEKARKEAESLRSEVLRALFPREHPPGHGKAPAPPGSSGGSGLVQP